MTELIETWATRPDEEDAMTEEHAWIWREMIRAIPGEDLAGARVLDIGCNQGGFLRLLHDQHPIAEGVGVDLARHAVSVAEARKGDRRLRYLAAPRLVEAGTGFDIATSHEVIYLISDLADHAAQLAEVLTPGGHYYAVTCCHRDNPRWSSWRPRLQGISNVPVPDHGVGDIAAAFRAQGFAVAVDRFLAQAFIPLDTPSDYFPTDLDRLEIYSRWKLLFRCTKPT
ncbi:MAG: class I SAM-dependent methyltransferase [Pseudomonadota bacterium]